MIIVQETECSERLDDMTFKVTKNHNIWYNT